MIEVRVPHPRDTVASNDLGAKKCFRLEAEARWGGKRDGAGSRANASTGHRTRSADISSKI
jgi:hypothetical protein